jgi:hypothetical protein
MLECHKTLTKREDDTMKAQEFRLRRLACCLGIFVFAGTRGFGQELPEKLPTKEDLANNNKLFAELASKYLHWEEPTDPVHIAGPSTLSERED